MRNFAWGAVLVAVALLASSCAFVFVERRPPRTPAYCYDCHPRPGWHRVHTRCDYYEIKIVRGGYRYRPWGSSKHVKFKFRKYDFSRDRETGEQGEKRERREGEKEKRHRR